MLILLLALANGMADHLHLYFLIRWLDIPMHILGGFCIAISALTLYFLPIRRVTSEHSGMFIFTLSISTALFLGLVWEIYEYLADTVVVSYGDQVGDTLKDLFDDFLGSLIAGTLFLWGGYNDRY